MDRQRIDEVLSQTLEDGRMSRSERRALELLLPELAHDFHELRIVRRRAFALARNELDSHHAVEVLDWLEEVMRVVAHAREEQPVDGVYEAIFSPGRSCVRRLGRLIENAQRSVEACVFTITDDRIARALVDAHRRGVRVRVISDDSKAFDPGSDIHRLGNEGVAVRVDRSPAHMHHKFALFDRKLLTTGSFNWTRSASEENHENLVVLDHRQLVGRFAAEFDRLWESFGGR